MGLDITAYAGLVKASGNEAFDERGEIKDDIGWIQLHENGDFPGRMDGLESGLAYRPSDSYRFRAGSYSGYNWWRNELAKLAGYQEAQYVSFGGRDKSHAAGAWEKTEGPFWELINFTDCDGVIGPVVAEKLAADFAAHQEMADAHTDERFRSLYTMWRKAFEMAANNGAVDFH